MYFQADIFNDNLKTYCELRDESLYVHTVALNAWGQVIYLDVTQNSTDLKIKTEK